MPYYVVGRDWPDHFYATNAKWPTPNNWTHIQEKDRQKYQASPEEVKRANEMKKQAVARRESKKLKKQLFNAIIQRDVDSVRQLVHRVPLLLERHTPYGATPLWLASAVGDPAIVAFLLDEGADVTEGDRVGATALIAAAYRGHTQVCQQLLNSKQGGNHGRAYLLRQATRRVGEVAAHAAAKGGHLDTLTALLAAGGEAAAQDREGLDCFMMAAAKDHPNVMSYLLQNHGIMPNRQDLHGRTALMHAAGNGAFQAVQFLLSLEPPSVSDLTLRDERGYGPLHHACLGGAPEVVELLTQHGMQLSPSDPQSLVLLRLACRWGHSAVVDWMLRGGMGLQELVEDGGGGPMFAAVRGGSAAVVDVLLRHGARIDVLDAKGRTPLGVAAEAGDTPLCRHLVSAGASLLAGDNHGRVPRELAYLANKRETAAALSGLARVRYIMDDPVVDEQMERELEEEARQRWA